MNKKLILSLLALAGVPALMMAADDARLLRFRQRTVMRLFSRMPAIFIKFLQKEVKLNA